MRIPTSYYLSSDTCTIDWSRDFREIRGVAFHRFVQSDEISVVHLMGTFVAPDSVRKVHLALRLQLEAIETHWHQEHLHWCFRTRKPLAYRAYRGYRDVLSPSEMASTSHRVARACFPGTSLKNGGRILSGSYRLSAAVSEFLEPAGPRFPDIDYTKDECLFFTGPVDIAKAKRYSQQLRHGNAFETNIHACH